MVRQGLRRAGRSPDPRGGGLPLEQPQEFLGGPNTNRFLAPPMDIMNRGIGLNLERKSPEENKGVLISGCRSDQTSADAWMHTKFMGAATYFLIESLKSVDTYSELVESMNNYMVEYGYTQRPQFNGNSFYRAQRFLEPLQPALDV